MEKAEKAAPRGDASFHELQINGGQQSVKQFNFGVENAGSTVDINLDVRTSGYDPGDQFIITAGSGANLQTKGRGDVSSGSISFSDVVIATDGTVTVTITNNANGGGSSERMWH